MASWPALVHWSRSEALDEEVFMTAWAEGRAMSLEQAVEYALADENK